MLHRFLASMLIIWLLCTIASNIIEKQDGLTSDDVSLFESFAAYEQIEGRNIIGNALTTLSVTGDVVNALWQAFWFDYSFMQEGLYVYLRYFFLCISLAVAFSVVYLIWTGLRS